MFLWFVVENFCLSQDDFRFENFQPDSLVRAQQLHEKSSSFRTSHIVVGL